MYLLKNFELTAMAFIIVACGGKKIQEKEESQDEVLNEYQTEEVVTSMVEQESPAPESTNPIKDRYGNLIYEPPFSFTAHYKWTTRVKDWETQTYVEKPSDILTFEITLKKGGMFTGRQKEIFLDYGLNYSMYDKVDTTKNINLEITGKWNDSYLRLGNGYLKCYNLESPDFEKDWSLYLMGNGEFAWYCRYPWLKAEEWKTENRMTISSIKPL